MQGCWCGLNSSRAWQFALQAGLGDSRTYQGDQGGRLGRLGGLVQDDDLEGAPAQPRLCRARQGHADDLHSARRDEVGTRVSPVRTHSAQLKLQ